jgi:hypothetical protein
MLTLAGCSGEEHPATGKVTGVVRYKGTPLPGGTVTFIEAANMKKGQRSAAAIDLEGNFVMPTAPLGAVKVIVTGPTPSSDPNKRKEKVLQIPAQYADTEKSDLTYTVVAGTQEFNIDLK